MVNKVSSKMVDYLQGGTGSTTRALEDKLQDVVSVKDFGAVGDGVTDDTAAVQAALNTGSPVDLLDGTYLITSPLMITTSNQIIISRNATIKADASFVGMWMLDFDTSAAVLQNNQLIGTLIIDGNNQAVGGVRFGEGTNQCAKFKIGHLDIRDCDGESGLYLNTVWDSEFESVDVVRCGTALIAGCKITSTSGTTNESIFTRLHVEDCPAVQVDLSKILHCYFWTHIEATSAAGEVGIDLTTSVSRCEFHGRIEAVETAIRVNSGSNTNNDYLFEIISATTDAFTTNNATSDGATIDCQAITGDVNITAASNITLRNSTVNGRVDFVGGNDFNRMINTKVIGNDANEIVRVNNCNDVYIIGCEIENQHATGLGLEFDTSCNRCYISTSKFTTGGGVPLQVGGVTDPKIDWGSCYFSSSPNVFTAASVKDAADGDATPSVLNARILRLVNTAPTTVTNLDDGYKGQEVTIFFQDSNTTVDFTATNLKGNGGVDLSATANDAMRCVLDDNGTTWHCFVSTG